MNRTAFAALAVAAALLVPAAGRAHDHHAMMDMQMMPMGKPMAGASVYNLPETWTDQDGKPLKLQDLRGRPVVLAMAYTACKEMCPMTVETMRRIEDKWAQRSQAPVTFAFFSFDTARDTPQHLKDYAAAHGLDAAHWRLLNGDEAAVRDLAAVLGVAYRREANGDFNHAYAISVLDADGVVAEQQTGLNTDVDAVLAKLAQLTPAKP